ncbi:hypothetical protein J1TS3_27470 [Siminovitchia fordii]|uniref:Uncharacterized protein n=1 Tax=Siminovitchia fordii TaxID=254759 RepID=A0ABQ4K9R9_9BACI|nr:hypothetical protein J1TS3_27470 [Siminovitchia fordii]
MVKNNTKMNFNFPLSNPTLIPLNGPIEERFSSTTAPGRNIRLASFCTLCKGHFLFGLIITEAGGRT